MKLDWKCQKTVISQSDLHLLHSAVSTCTQWQSLAIVNGQQSFLNFLFSILFVYHLYIKSVLHFYLFPSFFHHLPPNPGIASSLMIVTGVLQSVCALQLSTGQHSSNPNRFFLYIITIASSTSRNDKKQLMEYFLYNLLMFSVTLSELLCKVAAKLGTLFDALMS